MTANPFCRKSVIWTLILLANKAIKPYVQLVPYCVTTGTSATQAAKKKNQKETHAPTPHPHAICQCRFQLLIFHLKYWEVQGNYFTAILSPNHKPSSFSIIYKQAYP